MIKIAVTLIIIAIAGLGIGYYIGYDNGWERALWYTRGKTQNITSFDECAKAGYPIMKSYPRQCRTPQGKTFTEDISGSTGEFWGSIQGAVLLGPTCPVVMNPPQDECEDKPYATSLVITTADESRIIKEVNSDSNGRFSAEVPPGEYNIRSAAAANVLPYCASNEAVKVNANDYAEVTIYCDTGIR